MTLNKSCDQCRLRKVRCVVPPPKPNSDPATQTICVHCSNRNEACNFSKFGRRARVKVSSNLLFPNSLVDNAITTDNELFVDKILRCGPQDVVLCDESTVLKVPDNIVPSSTVTFFSENRITSLADRLGTESLRELVTNLDGLIKQRVCQRQTSQAEGINFREADPVRTEPQMVQAFIKAFFTNIHPVYPFLDQSEFISQATDTYIDDVLHINPAFCALYHAVLALGSQFFHCGSFVPHQGQAWELFQVSLGKMSEILAPPIGLMNLQALTAMSIFSMNACCLQLDQTLISEAARMAQALKYHKSRNSDATQINSFWTVYFIEKLSAFSESQSSILVDEDIGCVIPVSPESVFGDYDWFTSAIRLARISSIAFSELFSVSASFNSRAVLATGIRRIRHLLDGWRISIPPFFRPGEAIQYNGDLTASMKLVLLQTQYAYYNIVFGLERLTLHLNMDETNIREESENNLINAARTVAELVVFIDFEPHIPIFVSGIMPLSALFILFDHVIHNPCHTRTEENITLLDTVSRYFAVMDSISIGALPGSIISEFASIARQYVSKVREGTFDKNPDGLHVPTSAEWTADNSTSPDNSLSSYLSSDNNMSKKEEDQLKELFREAFPDWGNISF